MIGERVVKGRVQVEFNRPTGQSAGDEHDADADTDAHDIETDDTETDDTEEG